MRDDGGQSESTTTGTLRNFGLSSRLHGIDVPMLLTCGDRDEAGVKTVDDSRDAFPEAQMAVLPKASHMHQVERPGLYKTIARGFPDELKA